MERFCKCFLVHQQKLSLIKQYFIHTNSIQCNKSNQIAKTFIKVGTKFGNKPKAKKPYFSPNVSQPDMAMKSIVQEKRRKFLRRENALNKLFMSHITDIMSTGNFSDELVGKGIEISHVKVSSDFQFLNVFWMAKEKNTVIEDIQNVLDTYASSIRHELSQLRIVGNVPQIRFIKDRFKNHLTEINSLLDQADYGEDFIPVYPSLMKPENINTSDPNTLTTLALNDMNEMPPMRNDVFRLDYTVIMDKIQQAVHKSKAHHRKTDIATPLYVNSLENNEETGCDKDDAVRSLSYSEFIKNQKRLKSKMLKEKMAIYEDSNDLNENDTIEIETEEEMYYEQEEYYDSHER